MVTDKRGVISYDSDARIRLERFSEPGFHLPHPSSPSQGQKKWEQRWLLLFVYFTRRACLSYGKISSAFSTERRSIIVLEMPPAIYFSPRQAGITILGKRVLSGVVPVQTTSTFSEHVRHQRVGSFWSVAKRVRFTRITLSHTKVRKRCPRRHVLGNNRWTELIHQ